MQRTFRCTFRRYIGRRKNAIESPPWLPNPPSHLLGYPEGLPELGLGLRDVLGLLLGEQDVGGGALAVLVYRLLRRSDPRLGVALTPRRLHQLVLGLACKRDRIWVLIYLTRRPV